MEKRERQDKAPRRIELTGQDPWVHQRLRGEVARRARPARREPGGQEYRPERLKQDSRRKQNIVLSLLFAGLALVVFAASQLMAPRLVVRLDVGQGVVYVDGEREGVTGEVLGPFTVGAHEVAVRPELGSAQRLLRLVELGYAVAPRELRFKLPGLPTVSDSLDGGASR